MTYSLPAEAQAAVDAASPGLQLVAFLSWAAEHLDEDQRTLLSYAASSLVNRGWLSPLPKLLEAASDSLGIAPERLGLAQQALADLGLFEVDGERIVSIAAVLATGKTDITYHVKDDHEERVQLTGPLAALGIARGLSRPGEVVAKCRGTDETKTRVTLVCDVSGVHSRKPESVAMFLPDWKGDTPPSAALRGGGLFLDDDALAEWQTRHDDPDGMPLTSMFFPMAATDLGDKLGTALESMLDHVANFA